ncbi:yecA family protein [Klebsiella pneumoniae]|nr:yecA family protein [Klebsiella pneumoniae]STS66991.1 yecA family protein [Klebsiella pneumoniae]STS71004.1 yecA family protein [Klebsiella pneumoniae]
MNTGPLNENELEWLDDTLAKYAAEGFWMSLNWMAC